ncbi:hypothetical protein B0T26DRAFT_677261 [Lasiosphaeria miniovina]|uniref:Uncharacterized protein n=1 Tax=Lasiosphaeria miniovina TaxID=1954250 RepID=A0AA40DRG5_9PEZI|nr:uncharacterized protein B0T26DRAFT_677261 [Lasiosphaeria miniovina]KAK0712850.1 hypothetical protein B0T26DRAFT_677261 [Lasiosphaeria miniovina]
MSSITWMLADAAEMPPAPRDASRPVRHQRRTRDGSGLARARIEGAKSHSLAAAGGIGALLSPQDTCLLLTLITLLEKPPWVKVGRSIETKAGGKLATKPFAEWRKEVDEFRKAKRSVVYFCIVNHDSKTASTSRYWKSTRELEKPLASSEELEASWGLCMVISGRERQPRSTYTGEQTHAPMAADQLPSAVTCIDLFVVEVEGTELVSLNQDEVAKKKQRRLAAALEGARLVYHDEYKTAEEEKRLLESRLEAGECAFLGEDETAEETSQLEATARELKRLTRRAFKKAHEKVLFDADQMASPTLVIEESVPEPRPNQSVSLLITPRGCRRCYTGLTMAKYQACCRQATECITLPRNHIAQTALQPWLLGEVPSDDFTRVSSLQESVASKLHTASQCPAPITILHHWQATTSPPCIVRND